MAGEPLLFSLVQCFVGIDGWGVAYELALIKAVERYDPGRDVAFSSYAVPTIVGEIKRYYRDHTWVVHVPRDLSDLALPVQRVAAELGSRAGHAATRSEIAEALGVREQDVADARAALHARRPDSFDTRPEVDGDEPRPPSLERRCGTEDMGFERAEQRALGDALLRYLPPRDREVLHLYYEADMTQKAIGKRLGITQMQVSRILTRSPQRLQQLPHGLETGAPPPRAWRPSLAPCAASSCGSSTPARACARGAHAAHTNESGRGGTRPLGAPPGPARAAAASTACSS